MPGFPQIPTDLPVGLRRFLERVKEQLEVSGAERGSPLDATPTFRDLIDAGLIIVDPNAPLTANGREFTLNMNTWSDLMLPDWLTENVDPPVPTGLVVTQDTANIKLSWDAPTFSTYLQTLVYRNTANDLSGATLIGSTTGRTYVDNLPPAGSQYYYWLRQESQSHYLSGYNAVSGTSSSNQPGAPSVQHSFVLDQMVLSWTTPTSALAIQYYIITYGAAYPGGTPVGISQSNTLRIPVNWTGSRTFYVVPVDINFNLGLSGNTATSQNVPGTPSIQLAVANGSVVLTYSSTPGSFPVDHYEIRYGASWAAGTSYGLTISTRREFEVNFAGNRTYWVKGYDAIGNVSAEAQITFTPTLPSVSGLSLQVIDNNVLASWSSTPGTLPIDHYNLYRDAALIGTVGGKFATFFESAAGTYEYGVAAVDTAGNTGSTAVLEAVVNQPPDYVLNTLWDSQFDAPTHTNAKSQDENSYALQCSSSDYGYSTGSNLKSITGDFTLEAWCKLDVTLGSASNNYTVMGNEVFQASGLLFRIEDTTDANWGKVAVRTSQAGSFTTLTSAANKWPNDRAWHHFVARKSGSTFDIYIDGTSVATGGGATGAVTATKDWAVGAGCHPTPVQPFNGQLYGCRVYARALTPTEVSEHYKGMFKSESNLIGAWDFDEGQGTVVADDSDSSNDLALVDTPVFVSTTINGQLDTNQTNALYFPIKRDESYEEHFTTNSWTTWQDAINAGYNYYLEPSVSGASLYTEIFDYGTVLAATLITATLTKNDIEAVGGYTITPTISISLDASSWTDYAGVWSVFGTNFRYVKMKLDVSATGNKNLVRATELIIRLDTKLKNDAGMVNCHYGSGLSITRSGSVATVNFTAHGVETGDWVTIAGATQTEYNGEFVATKIDANNFSYTVSGSPATPATGTITLDSNGTRVDFTVAFIDISSITLTAMGTAARTEVVDFTDIPNPTTFRAYLFDLAGTRKAGKASWASKGA
jgi:hypothetical protein